MNIALVVLRDSALSILYFPLWWYTEGFFNLLKNTAENTVLANRAIGFTLWLKATFIPLYGQNDIGGRIVSFVLRVLNIIFRGLFLLIYIIFRAALLVLWLAAPILLISRLYIYE